MKTNRRQFLKTCAYGGLSLGASTLGLPKMSFANSTSSGVLVFVSLRGGCDGLNMLVPTDTDLGNNQSESDRAIYERHRPKTQITNPIPITEPTGMSRFGLHPKMAILNKLVNPSIVNDYHITFFPGTHTGSNLHTGNFGSFSHFTGQDIIDYGGHGADLNSIKTHLYNNQKKLGWIARHLHNENAGNDRILGYGGTKSAAFEGDNNIFTTNHLNSGVSFNAGQENLLLNADLQRAATDTDLCNDPSLLGCSEYQRQNDTSRHIELATLLKSERVKNIENVPSGGTSLYHQFANASTMIKGVDELQMIAINDDGYDHHIGLKNTLASKLSNLSQQLDIFRNSVNGVQKPIEVVVVTEFGRTVDENSSSISPGTDHGQAFCAMVMGAGSSAPKTTNINFGANGQWPGLESLVFPLGNRYYLGQLTDYRDILMTTMTQSLRFNSNDILSVFNDIQSSFQHQHLDFI